MSERMTYDWALYEIASNIEQWERLCKVQFTVEEKECLSRYLEIYKIHLDLHKQIREFEHQIYPHSHINEVTKVYKASNLIEEEINILVESPLLQNVLSYRFNKRPQNQQFKQEIEVETKAPKKSEQRENLPMKEQDCTKRMSWMLMPMVLSITIPLLMLDTPIWLMTLVDLIILSPMLLWSQKLSVVVPYAYYIIKPILYIWALVVTILGVQDFFAIAFYILMGIQTPRMIKNFIGTTLIIYFTATGEK